MEVNTKGLYALEALIYMNTKQQSLFSLKQIAEERNISLKYLEHIFSSLKSANIINSKRGKNGGYYLNINPKQLTIKQIFQCVIGPLEMIPCLNSYKCEREVDCLTRPIWYHMNQETLLLLQNTTLHKLSKQYTKEQSLYD